jgi:hypothetical protein
VEVVVLLSSLSSAVAAALAFCARCLFATAPVVDSFRVRSLAPALPFTVVLAYRTLTPTPNASANDDQLNDDATMEYRSR